VIYQRRLANICLRFWSHEPLIRQTSQRGGGVHLQLYWLVDGLMEQAIGVHLANPAAMQPFSG